MKNINTGTPRNVLGHVISGAIASAVISGAINYRSLGFFGRTRHREILMTSKFAEESN